MISTSQLAYQYRGGQVLHFPDIAVPQGESLLLKGPSGSGKSTWLALVAGLLRPTSGQVVVAGQDLVALSPLAIDAWRAKSIGFLPQKLHLSDALTVVGNLQIAQWAAGVTSGAQADAQLQRVLSSLGVAELALRRPFQLSGGQAQRVALARAVLMSPRVILADEPTASLDDAAAHAALSLLQKTAFDHGATLVIATHDARVAQALPQSAVCDLGVSATANSAGQGAVSITPGGAV